MEIKTDKNAVRIEGISSFNPVHIFECGQAFRWNWDGKGYVGIVKDKPIRVIWDGYSIILENTSLEDYTFLWKNYFDLEKDYDYIKRVLSQDSIMKEAIHYGWGIRILNQDPWETLISFIISANNGISRIKRSIENISRKFGKPVYWDEKEYYTFPDAECLAQAHENDLLQCGVGYRASYIIKTARMIQDQEIKLDDIKKMEYADALKIMLKFPGVGPKVADCVLLFSMEKGEAFPVDVWIQRIMETLYLNQDTTPSQIREFARNKFGNIAGYAQQYLFYYAREKKIGR